MSAAGFDFVVLAPDEEVENGADKNLPPRELVRRLAYLKAKHVSQIIGDHPMPAQLTKSPISNNETTNKPADRPSASGNHRAAAPSADEATPAIIVAADTVAICHEQILGKPANRDDAGRMLQLMSGQRHHVITGVCLWEIPTQKNLAFVEQSTLWMEPLSNSQLEMYLDTGQWKGKAGAFGYQDGLDWVHLEQGLASNVVGLPIERIPEWLQELESTR